MASVKCIALHAVDLSDGRLLPPGVVADNVEISDDDRLKIASGLLVVTDERPEEASSNPDPLAPAHPDAAAGGEQLLPPPAAEAANTAIEREEPVKPARAPRRRPAEGESTTEKE